MKAFGIEAQGRLLGTGNNNQVQESFLFRKPLWKVEVRCEPRASSLWPRAYVNLSIYLNENWSHRPTERVIDPPCDLRENPKELETFVRSWLDEVSLQLTEVYRAFPEEESTDPKEITLFGVECKQEDDRRYFGHDHLEYQGISVQLLIEPMEHTVSSTHVVKAEAEFTCDGGVRFIVEDDSNLDEIEGRMKEKMRRAISTLRANYLIPTVTSDEDDEDDGC